MMILIIHHPLEFDQNQHLNLRIKPNQRQRRFGKILFPSIQNEKVTSNCLKATKKSEGNKEMSVEKLRKKMRERETMEQKVTRHAGPVKHMLDPLNSINRRNTLFTSIQRIIMVVY